MSLVSNKTKKVFLSLNTKILENEKVDIILSPEFYWLRVFDIPVKTLNQARHVLPTLFEDIIDDISSISYQVQKLDDNRFLCFAYDNKKVYAAIKNSGISLSLVNSVYFSQNECEKFKYFKIENKNFLYTEDNILVKAPDNLFLQNIVDLEKEINKIDLSNHKVDIKLYNNVLKNKYLYSLIVLIFLISTFNFLKYFSYNSEKNNLLEKMVLIKKQASLPSSTIQTNSIINSYEKKLRKQKKLREALSYVLNNKEIKINNITLNRNEIKLTFLNSNKNLVEKYLKKKYKIISSKLKGLVLVVKVKI